MLYIAVEGIFGNYKDLGNVVTKVVDNPNEIIRYRLTMSLYILRHKVKIFLMLKGCFKGYAHVIFACVSFDS